MKILGYIIPTSRYPSPAVAFVAIDNDYALVYPSGTVSGVIVKGGLNDWATSHHVTLLSPNIDIQLGDGEYLYAVSEGEILLGNHAVISRNLSMQLSLWKEAPLPALHIARFIGADSLVSIFQKRVWAELSDQPGKKQLWDSRLVLSQQLVSSDNLAHSNIDRSMDNPITSLRALIHAQLSTPKYLIEKSGGRYTGVTE